MVISWAYRCPNGCEGQARHYVSGQAERLHLKHRRMSREMVVKIGYRRFWQHQTIYELHDWLSQELGLTLSVRQVMNLIADFLALLRAGQAAKIWHELGKLNYLVIGVDGMQPEKGNKSLYIVREIQSGLTLMAESLDEGSNGTLSQQLFEPLKVLAQKMDLNWRGVVSDAQKSIRLAVAHSLPGVPHQACHSHCLREAGQLTFEADRTMKKQLKAAIRRSLYRLEKRIGALPADNRFRSVLLDYAQAIHSTLLEGGIAPFELGGVAIFAALEELAASLERCQKKGRIHC